eukprot:6457058-Amphidinium_carterae.1
MYSFSCKWLEEGAITVHKKSGEAKASQRIPVGAQLKGDKKQVALKKHRMFLYVAWPHGAVPSIEMLACSLALVQFCSGAREGCLHVHTWSCCVSGCVTCHNFCCAPGSHQSGCTGLQLDKRVHANLPAIRLQSAVYVMQQRMVVCSAGVVADSARGNSVKCRDWRSCFRHCRSTMPQGVVLLGTSCDKNVMSQSWPANLILWGGQPLEHADMSYHHFRSSPVAL